MSRIGVIVDNTFNSDIRVRKEVSVLVAAGYEVFVLCYAFSGEVYPDVSGVICHRITVSRRLVDVVKPLFNSVPLYEWFWQREVSAFISRYQLGVIHAHDLYMARAARRGIEASGRSLPLILDLHENYPVAIQAYNWTKGWWRSRLVRPQAWIGKEAAYLKAADRLIVLSDHFKKELLDRYDWLQAENIVAYPNVIDLRRFEAFPVTPGLVRSTTVTMFYFGVVAERRGIFATLEVLRTCLADGLDLELLIIGPVDKADQLRFTEATTDLVASSRVTYLPWIEVSELPDYLYQSDICLSPLVKNAQHESGVANKLYQYMFGQRPIIVSDCIPQAELVTNLNCGLVYTNQETYVAAVKKLVQDEALRQEMGENGYRGLYERYDNDKFEDQLLGVYRSLSLSPALN